MKAIGRQIATIVATVSALTINILANALPINGQGQAEISARINVYFTPAGYVFSIWLLIYIGLIAYTVFQALPANRDNPTLQAIAPYYWLSSAANFGWILLWHYELFPLSVIAMLTLLGSLIMIYLELDKSNETASTGMKWAVGTTFSVYLGWITVATVANITAALWLAGWNAFGIAPETWTAIVLAVAVLIGAVMAITRGNAAYLLVLVWAFIGIYTKHADVPLVGISALVAAIAVAVMAVLVLIPGGPLPLAKATDG